MNVGRAETIHESASMSLTHRPEWLRDRQSGVGGSESGYLAGIFRNHLDPRPYESKLSVYLSKTEEISDEPRPITWSIPASRGTHLEPFAAQIYEERTGLVTTPVPMLRDPDYSWKLANVDRMVVGPSGDFVRGLEIKCPTVNSRHQWADGVPLFVRCQCQWYMTITGFRKWDVICLIDCDDRIFTVEQDDVLAERLHNAARAFWYEHVVPRQPPGPEMQAVAEWIHEYAPPVPGFVRRAIDSEEEIGERMLRCNDRIAVLKHRKAQLKAQLSSGLAEEQLERLYSDDWTMRSSEKAGRVKWEQVARDLARQLSEAHGGLFMAHELVEAVTPKHTGKSTHSVSFRAKG